MRMRVDAPELDDAAGAAIPSLFRPHLRIRSAAIGAAGAGLLPTVTVNRLNQDVSGTLSPPASGTDLRWPRGHGKTSDCGDFCQSGQRSALGNPRTSRTEFPARRWQRLPCRYQGLPRRQQLDLAGLTAAGLEREGRKRCGTRVSGRLFWLQPTLLVGLY